jgi:ADP-ribose pyrophosphatase YjhB (NUDIX family)
MCHEGTVLLVKSSNPKFDPPLWWLPGGGIDFGESPESALKREFLEETGLKVSEFDLLSVITDVRDRSTRDRVHTVRIVYKASYDGGELVHEQGGTTKEARWFTPEEILTLHLAEYAREALIRFGFLQKQ